MKIYIYDTTLRDGAQGEGINFSVEDKLEIVKALDSLGVDFIEGGNPFSSALDKEFFQKAEKLKLKNSVLTAFGSTRRKNSAAKDDLNLNALLESGCGYLAIVGKSRLPDVLNILNVSPADNLNMIGESVEYLKSKGKKVIFDAENFFQSYKTDKEYAIECIKRALAAKADKICLCDTNGGAFPDEISKAVKKIKKLYKDVNICIHCHNDGGLAAANSIAAVLAGANEIQGTLTGCGERCGNANLSTVIPSLVLKKNYSCLNNDLSNLRYAALKIAEISNIQLDDSLPYVGRNAFSHKAGMHSDAVLKDNNSFEHIAPELVGNERRYILSEMAGRSALINKISDFFPRLKKDSPEIEKIMSGLKALSAEGWQFEGAEASFVLWIKKQLKEFKESFKLINLKCISEQPEAGKSASAILKVEVKGVSRISAGEGDGPVHAMDIALRTALSEFYPCIKEITLKDYKVRVLNAQAATAAKVRVLITSTDGKNTWTTMGVSKDIIEASYIALTDSIEYKLNYL